MIEWQPRSTESQISGEVMARRQFNPKQLIDEIRREWRVEELVEGGGDNYVELARNTLPLLTQELYESHIHFLSELIQNADDNAYPKGVTPSLTVTADENGYIIINNELGFEPKHVRAICSAGKSTKADRKQEYTGEKGIGFKAVFQVTDRPEIHSNGYHFCFDRTLYGGLGSIIPEWIEGEDDEQPGTRIVLPARDGYIDLNFAKHLQPEILLFLRRLRHVELKDVVWQRCVSLTRSDKDGVVRVREYAQDDYKPERNREAEHHFWSCRRRVDMRDIEEPRRRTITATEVAVALPLDNNGEVVANRDRRIFAFLPVRPSSLRFLVHADFVLSTSRDTIREDLPWNGRLRDALGECLADAILSCRGMPGPGATALRVLVEPERIRDDFLEPILAQALDKLKSSESIPTVGGQWVRPDDAMAPDPDGLWRLVREQDALALLGRHYVQPNVSGIGTALKLLGVRAFSVSDLIACFEDEEWRKRGTVKWFARLYVALACAKLSKSDFEDLRGIPILRLRNGRLTAPDDDTVFIDLDQQTEYGFEDDLSLIDPQVLRAVPKAAQSEVREFFTNLGVRSARPVDIIDAHVVPIHERDAWRFVPAEVLIGHLHYVRDHLPEYREQKGNEEHVTNCLASLRIRTDTKTGSSLRYALAEDLYVGPEYDTRYDLRSVLGEQSGNGFVSADYLTRGHPDGDEAARSAWRKLFISIGADEFPPIYDGEEDGDYVWREDVTKLLQGRWSKRKKELLRIIDGEWDTKYAEFACRADQPRLSRQRAPSTMLVELRQSLVPKKGGGTAKLESTYLDNEHNRAVFGTAVPYLDLDLSNGFADALGVVREPTVDYALARLESLSGTSEASGETLRSLYAFLSSRYSEHAKPIQTAFASSRCIGIPHADGIEWRKKGECCWTVPKKLRRLLGVASIGVAWKEFERFFCDELGVPRTPTPESYVAALETLQGESLESSQVPELTHQLYRQINEHCELLLKTDDDLPEWAHRLQEGLFLLSTRGEWWRNDDDVFLADDPELEVLFENTDDVAFVDVPRAQHTTLRPLFTWLQVRRLSEAISARPRPNLKEKLWPELHRRLNERSEVLARYLHHKHVSAFRRLLRDGSLNRLFGIEGRVCEPLELDVYLNDLAAISRFPVRLVEDNGRWVFLAEPAAMSQWTDVGFELARYLQIEDEAGVILGQLLDDEPSRVEGLLQKLKVSELPEELAIKLFGGAAEDNSEDELDQLGRPHDDQPFDAASAAPPSQGKIPPGDMPGATPDGGASCSEDDSQLEGPEPPGQDNGDVPPDEGPLQLEGDGDGAADWDGADTPDESSGDAPANDRHPRINGDGVRGNGAAHGGKLPASPPVPRQHQAPTQESGTDDLQPKEDDDAAQTAGQEDQQQVQEPGDKRGSGRDSSPRVPHWAGQETKRQSHRRNKTDERLRSYVSSFDEADREDNEDENDHATRSAAIEHAAVTQVLAWERAQGRVPEDRNTKGDNQKGYDIASRNGAGMIERYIEVKGTEGAWGRRGVMVTPAQFDFARRNGDLAWLYVVEHATTDQPVIHRIQNFATRVWRFGFDEGWAEVGEEGP